MVIFAGFVAAFIASFGGFFAFKPPENPSPQVLAVATAMPIETPFETSLPSPSPTLNPEPSPSPTQTSKPSVLPTATMTPIVSPSPSTTPTPSPQVQALAVSATATPDVWSPSSLEPFFAQYAGAYGVDKNALERIANCESHFNPSAKNGDYLGIFQFSTGTWAANRTLMGMDTNPALRANVEESIRTAAFLISKRGTSPWPACSR